MSTPTARGIIVPIARLHAEADPGSMMVSELLFGETVEWIDSVNGWSRVRAHADGYEGFVAPHTLAGRPGVATHRVAVRATLRFPIASIKSTPAIRLPLGARLRIEANAAPGKEGLLPISDGGFVPACHLAPLQRDERTPLVELARRFYLGAPYLWGGRSPDGCDCSGLVQSVSRLAGHFLPRDSGPQEVAIAQDIALEDRQAGDLMFWPGHVAIAMSQGDLIHANAHTMSVAIEPLSQVIARAGRPSSLRRLPGADAAPTDRARGAESAP